MKKIIKIILLIGVVLSVIFVINKSSSVDESSIESSDASSDESSDILAQKEEINLIEHFNICIVPDLSNRLDMEKCPKPIDDSQFVNAIIDDIYPAILKNRVDMYQPDKIFMRFTSPKIINYYNINNSVLKFDFERFGSKQIERINYLANRDKKGEFEKDKRKFKNEFKNLIRKARQKYCGADIWSFFNNELDETFIRTDVKEIKNKTYTTEEKYKNIVVLFTDGYIEAGLYAKTASQGNKLYHLSSNSIREFRRDFKRSNEKNIKTFFDKHGYGLVPLNNPILKNVEVLAVEFYDRSLSSSGNATVHPTDGEILNIFWNDWMIKSGVKRFESCKISSNVEGFMRKFHEFAGIHDK